eukprot:TRINITY_DN2968_c0_g1_i2.p1 TRINITY_DN2968_c0_g1~~TRINITY_DN2968_c0_g1_i2.p1  ORF type:complete len:525 (+),score=51.10 TRINITY_DN2968_c0_g1_i2:25-1599(+)
MHASQSPSAALLVTKLSSDVPESLLRQVFSRYGTVTSVSMQAAQFSAIVTYNSVEDAVAAHRVLQGAMFGKQPISISFHSEPKTQTLSSDTPTPAPAPSDDALRELIDRFAEACVRFGPRLADMARMHHPSDGFLQFLHGPSHQGHAYYRWRVHCLQTGLSAEQAAGALRFFQATLPSSQSTLLGPDLPMPENPGPDYFNSTSLTLCECIDALVFVDSLTEQADAIRNAGTWFLHLGQRLSHALQLVDAALRDPEFAVMHSLERKVLVIYLITDIVHQCSAAPYDTVAAAALAALPSNLSRLVHGVVSYQTVENCCKILRHIEWWEERRALPIEVLVPIKQIVRTALTNAEASRTQPPQPPPPYIGRGLVLPGRSPPMPPADAVPEQASEPQVPSKGPPALNRGRGVSHRGGARDHAVSSGNLVGLQHLVDRPYTPLNAALAPPPGNMPSIPADVKDLPQRLQQGLESFYREIYPKFGTDREDVVRDFGLAPTKPRPAPTLASPAPMAPPPPKRARMSDKPESG